MPSKARFQIIDILRGVAILLMIVYHFFYDLKFFGYLNIHFSIEPFWIGFRGLIVSLFVALVGISLVLSTRRGMVWHRYLKRLGLLLLCSGAITIMSVFMFPNHVILFGILHFITLSSIVGLFFIRFKWTNLLLGIGLLSVAQVYQNPLFDQPLLYWIGFTTYLPATEDYVPFVKWFGVVLIGIFIGKFWQQSPHWEAISHWHKDNPATKLVALLGRHSLFTYMVHQPVLFAILWPVYWFTQAG